MIVTIKISRELALWSNRMSDQVMQALRCLNPKETVFPDHFLITVQGVDHHHVTMNFLGCGLMTESEAFTFECHPHKELETESGLILYGVPPPMELNITIPGKDPKDTVDNLSWILRGFLVGVAQSLIPGSSRRHEAVDVARGVIGSIQDPVIRASILNDVERFMDPNWDPQ